MSTIDDLLNGASLTVLLHPRKEVQISFPDMKESFRLPHILVKDNRFFAKTANCHAISSGFSEYDQKASYSYAYSNHYKFFINCSHTENMLRAGTINSYGSIKFITHKNYEKIWDSEIDKSVESVEHAITAGKRLKIALLDEAGFWNIHPVHMPSFYIGENYFELFTEQDAMPNFIRSQDLLNEMQSAIKNKLKENVTNKTPKDLFQLYSSIVFDLNPVFDSAYYTVRSNGDYLQGKTVLVEEDRDRKKYKLLRVFAEA